MKKGNSQVSENANCGFSIELLSAYLDNELNESEKNRVEEHLNQCLDCKRIIEEFRTIDSKLQELAIDEPSREFIFNLNKNVMDKIRKPSRFRLWQYFPVLIPAAVAVLLVIVVTSKSSLEHPVGMKNRIQMVLTHDETPATTEKIDVVIPKPGIIAKPRTTAPAPSRFAEKKAVADKELAASREEAQVPATVSGVLAQEKREQVVVRAVIDSTGRVLNVATGNTIMPEEDTAIYRLLKSQQFAAPKIRGKPTQMVIEFVADATDTTDNE